MLLQTNDPPELSPAALRGGWG